MTSNPFAPSSDPNDRIMAALAQVTILVPLLGVIGPILIWVTQKDKSQYVAFQSLQAVVYQLSIIVFWMLGMGCYLCSFFGMFAAMFPIAGMSGDSADPAVALLSMLPVFVPFGVMGLLLLGWLIFTIYGCVAAVLVFLGRDFRYLVIGNRLARYLQREQAVSG